MSTSRSRIDLLVLLALLAAGGVLAHLFVLMVADHQVWAARSDRNRWAFRSVPSMRGAIRDRAGRILVYDEPTTELSIYYLRFRLYHPVGAAVHGATTWARLHPGRELATYGYEPGALGPAAAARDLLAMPAGVLRRGVLPKETAAGLRMAVTTVLAATSGMPRRRVYTALRETGAERPETACGDVLDGFPRDELLDAYDGVLQHLRWFDARLALHRDRPTGGLFEELDWLRVQSLARRCVWIREVVDDEVHWRKGELWETVSRRVAEDVPFDLSATLRLGRLAHPGLMIRPALRRVHAVDQGTALHSLLSDVRDLGRLRSDVRDFDDHQSKQLPEDWLQEIVPDDVALPPGERERLAAAARRRFEAATMRFERGGVAGVERAFDAELGGHLGMRLVERDSRRRERWMWSSLRVRQGDDVRITIDSDFQEHVERIVDDALARFRLDFTEEADRKRVHTALAVIDARSGDVLAMAGAPVKGPHPLQVPGATWFGNGSLGSVVKPFVLVEQLLAERTGAPHKPIAEFDPCDGKFRYGGIRLSCVRRGHWEEGRDPVAALAKSCNEFFYQAGVGLGMAGVDRALSRFGLREPPADSPLLSHWQPRVTGLDWSRPRIGSALTVPQRAIGYGVEASPLAVARAYAGIATGRLPTLGLRFGEVRAGVPLDEVAVELEVVRQGLWDCVRRGTASRVEGLTEYDVFGKTGTAEVGSGGQNNAWFAGFVSDPSPEGVQLAFCAVIYWVPNGRHGAEAAGTMVARMLARVHADPVLRHRYLASGEGR